MPIKIVLTCHKLLLLQGIHLLLSRNEHFEVKGTATEIFDLFELIHASEPDILIIHTSMASELINYERLHEVCSYSKVLLLVDNNNLNSMNAYLKDGIAGVITIDKGIDELEKAIFTVYNDKTFYSTEIVEQIVKEYVALNRNRILQKKENLAIKSEKRGLTNRQLEILLLMSEGKKTAEIAKSLALSIYTVETHRKNMMLKLQAKNAVELLKKAIKQGLL